MDDVRINSIEKRFKYAVVIDEQGRELALELIQALRAEQAKVAELEKQLSEMEEYNDDNLFGIIDKALGQK